MCSLSLQAIFIFSLVTYTPLTYNEYSYPVWGQVIGWVMALSSIMCIPGVMIFKVMTIEGTLQEVIIPHIFSVALGLPSDSITIDSNEKAHQSTTLVYTGVISDAKVYTCIQIYS